MNLIGDCLTRMGLTTTDAWEKCGLVFVAQGTKDRFGQTLRDFLSLIDITDIRVLIDIGSGDGNEAFLFDKLGIDVICSDLGRKPRYPHLKWFSTDDLYSQRGLAWPERGVDAVWACHVLEHVLNPIETLIKWRTLLRDGGSLLISVPLGENAIVTGHINQYTVPCLLYQLAIAGFDCSASRVAVMGNVGIRTIHAWVQKSGKHDPEVDGLVFDLSKLAKKDVFPASVNKAIVKSVRDGYLPGRFSAKDIQFNIRNNGKGLYPPFIEERSMMIL